MNLRQNEKLVATVRQHWLAISSAVSVLVGVAILLVVAMLYFRSIFFGYGWEISIFILLATTAYLFYKIFIWRRNELIITSERIINNEQRGIFSRTVTELLYHDITDVSYSQSGITEATYNFGTIKIRLPSNTEVVVEKIPKPGEVIELINKIRVTFK